MDDFDLKLKKYCEFLGFTFCHPVTEDDDSSFFDAVCHQCARLHLAQIPPAQLKKNVLDYMRDKAINQVLLGLFWLKLLKRV